jgi:hypothetical protein
MGAFIQVYASRWEVQYQVGEVFSFKFELSMKGIVIISGDQLLRKKTQLWTWLLIIYRCYWKKKINDK